MMEGANSPHKPTLMYAVIIILVVVIVHHFMLKR